MGAEGSFVADVVGQVLGAYLDGVRARQSDIDAVVAAYDRAIQDERVIIPSYLMAALESLR